MEDMRELENDDDYRWRMDSTEMISDDCLYNK